jgi:hypothetical protein
MNKQDLQKIADRRLLRKYRGKLIADAWGDVEGIIRGIKYRSESHLELDQVGLLIEVEDTFVCGWNVPHKEMEETNIFFRKEDYNPEAKYYYIVNTLEQLELC